MSQLSKKGWLWKINRNLLDFSKNHLDHHAMTTTNVVSFKKVKEEAECHQFKESIHQIRKYRIQVLLWNRNFSRREDLNLVLRRTLRCHDVGTEETPTLAIKAKTLNK